MIDSPKDYAITYKTSYGKFENAKDSLNNDLEGQRNKAIRSRRVTNLTEYDLKNVYKAH